MTIKAKNIIIPLSIGLIILVVLVSQQYKKTGIRPTFSGSLFVSNKFGNTVNLIDLETYKSINQYKVGIEPHEIAISNDNKYIVVGNYKDPSLTVIDRTKNDFQKKILLNNHKKPHGLTFINGNKLLVTSETQKKLILIDVSTDTIERVIDTAPHESHMVVYHKQNHWVVTTNLKSSSVSIIDLKNDSLVRNIAVGQKPEGIDISPDGKEIWVANGEDNSISVIATDELKVIETINTGQFPIRLKFTTDGKHVVVNCKGSKEISLFDAASKSQLKTKSLVKSRMEEFFTHTEEPIGLLMHPDGEVAFISSSNADCILLLDLKRWEIIQRIETGYHPDGMGFVQ